MTASPTDSSTQGTEERLQRASTQNSQDEEQDTDKGVAMLSVDFSAPLAGPARSERICQMSQNHPAFEKTRAVQEMLVKIQHSLRRMPGVSAGESSQIFAQLQEIGQIVSHETGKLVEALANLLLDQQDTSRAIARMGIETGLVKAQNDDQSQMIRDLRAEVASAKREGEAAISELETLKGQADKTMQGRDGLMKDRQAAIRHIEDKVNGRRSMWAPRNPDQQSLNHAVETLTVSVEKDMMRRAGMGINGTSSGTDDRNGRRADADVAFDHTSRPSTVAPPKFGPLQAGPPRGQSAFNGQAASWTGRSGQPQQQQQTGIGISPFYTGPTPPSTFRPPTRKAYQAPGRFRNDYTASGYGMLEGGGVPIRPNTGFGGGTRQAILREPYPPQTPTSNHRAGRFSREREAAEFGSASTSSTSTAVVRGSSVSSSRGGGSGWTGPAPDTSDGTIASWNGQIMEFYAMIRAFVERHANVPDAHMALKMNTTALWPVLLATYHPLSAAEASSYLDIHLRSDNPKCCLVTRVIIDYIVNRAWVPHAWAGSDNESTYALSQLWDDFGRAQGQSSSHLQPLLDRQAHIVEGILKAELGTEFHNNKVSQVTESLLATIQPLLNRLTNPAEAQRDMESVVQLAWELSFRILTSRLTFDFRFPEVGSRFSSQSMLPIWPPMDPMDLQAKHWRVALVTTPVITCRSDTGGNISAHSIALADVYCMQ